MFNRVAAFLYGVISYLAFFASFLYSIGFLINVGVPKGIDSGRQASLLYALAIDCGLLTLFAAQHSVMARPWFKHAWTKFVPEPVERSTYVLFSSVAMILLFWKWEPIGGVIWSVEQPGARYLVLGFYALGWAILLLATFLINHFDLFGLRQVWLHLLGRPYTQLHFNTPLLYKYMRHPLYVGWLMIFWSARGGTKVIPRPRLSHCSAALPVVTYRCHRLSNQEFASVISSIPLGHLPLSFASGTCFPRCGQRQNTYRHRAV